ncbi:MAG TPA: hypothetical protein VKF82_09475 [Candidatus Eremiobacteraceae bacterium]|nr:hypothetical protein [Candidatus Eremiobacteraceae bacterium]
MRLSINKAIDAAAAVLLIAVLFAPLAGQLRPAQPHRTHVTAMHAPAIAALHNGAHVKQ